MSRSASKFKINQPNVITENFDDEVVAINLETGCYYSMEKSGTIVWLMVNDGATLSEIIAEINQRYIGDSATIEGAIQQFVAELERKQLIVVQSDGVSEPPTRPHKQPLPLFAKTNFDPPLLCEYTDMQELFLIDPIHDASPQGWPAR